MKTNGFLTILVFIKIHLENSHFTFALRLRQNERDVEFVSLVCCRFRFFLALKICINLSYGKRWPNVSSKSKSRPNKKHTVKPTRR